MRKLKLVKVVVPEIVAYMQFSDGEKVPDYRCPHCGFGVEDDYVTCPHCGSELDWKHVIDPVKEKFKQLTELYNSK